MTHGQLARVSYMSEVRLMLVFIRNTSPEIIRPAGLVQWSIRPLPKNLFRYRKEIKEWSVMCSYGVLGEFGTFECVTN